MNKFISSLITLPEPIKAGLSAVVLYVVSFAFANLILLAPFLAFLEPFKLPLATAAAMALIAWIQNAIPDMYERVAIAALQLVLAILAVYGIGSTLAAMGAMPSLLAP
jgi:hypothetical protein